MSFDLPEGLADRWIAHSRALLGSYRALTGAQLLPITDDAAADARRLFNAPFVVVSHGPEPDPILNYGNRLALELWEVTAAQFVAMPSRLTAEPMLRETREHVLRETAQKGFVRGYEGVRISATGRRFTIREVTLWNVSDASGRALGQAAVFPRPAG